MQQQREKRILGWMDSIKFAVEYANPFWRENNYSGTLFSQASIIQKCTITLLTTKDMH
jgi:monoamine oxidase